MKETVMISMPLGQLQTIIVQAVKVGIAESQAAAQAAPVVPAAKK